MSVPITVIREVASYDAITRIDNDYQFKKGNTDWELKLTLKKNNTEFDSEITKVVLVQDCTVIGEITTDMYTLSGGELTILGHSGLVSEPGFFSIYIIINNNVSWKVSYNVMDDLTFLGDIVPLPDVDATINGNMIIYNTTTGQTVTEKIDEMDEYIDNLNTALTTAEIAIIDIRNNHKYYGYSSDSEIVLTGAEQLVANIDEHSNGDYRLYISADVIRTDNANSVQTISMNVYNGEEVIISKKYSTYKDFETGVSMVSGIKYNLSSDPIEVQVLTTGGTITISNVNASIEGGA